MKRKKEYWEMNTAELRKATRQYDREMPGLPGKPLTAYDRGLLAKARRRGRSLARPEIVRIHISLEPALLTQTNAAAKKWGISRSELIARGLRQVLKRAG
jgi:hypothetical protein